MTDNIIVNIAPNLDEKEVKKQNKKLERIFSKSSDRIAKTLNSKIAKGIIKGAKKGAKTAGKIAGAGGVAGVALGAVAGLVGSSEKGLTAKENTEKQAEAITTLSEIGKLSEKDSLKIIQGLENSGQTFEEAVSTLANFIDKRASAQLEGDLSFAAFSQGNTAEDFKKFVNALENTDDKLIQQKLANEIIGDSSSKIFRTGNVGQAIETAKPSEKLVKEIIRVEQQSRQEQIQENKLNRSSQQKQFQANTREVSKAFLKSVQEQNRQTVNSINNLPTQLDIENLGSTIKGSIGELKTETIAKLAPVEAFAKKAIANILKR